MSMTLPELSKKMANIDIAMLTTLTADGIPAARPMSNNGQVEYEGDSYYFTWDGARMVTDIEQYSSVELSFQGSKGLLGKPPFLMSVQGQAQLIRDKNAFAAHWTRDLDRWFEQGLDTPGVVMIKVSADRIHYWDGEDDGTLVMHEM